MERDEEIFAAALDLPTADRPGFVDRACGGDDVRRARVTALLRGHERSGRFLEESAAGTRGGARRPAEPQRIGRYRLLERIGEGGCGIVYAAEQEEPIRRRVALKIIKVGMDTAAVIARFEAERQALALMDHPNIAKVFDAGASETGRPYFVMELVRGMPITAYCDQNRLPISRRLELFLPVCAALQHAHQKGIVHRDLKPSNVLVADADGVPVPKVIDFGVAKAMQGRLTDHTLYTRVEAFIGTPAYMSPEQADMSGLAIDARTDVYSLGVMLYELLAGRLPVDAQHRTLHGEELTPPSRVAPALKGDLDWIVMRCLETDRNRRYASAHELALDLERYLGNRPVLARPPRLGYRLGKFMRRQRTPLAIGAAAAVGLGLGAWWWIAAGRPAPAASSASTHARQLTDAAYRVSRTLDFTPEDLKVAEDECRQATELDPRSARAWGVRAWNEATFIFRYWDRGPSRQEAAQTLAQHALSLDPDQPDALLAEVEVLVVRRAFAAAEPLARRAVAAAPDDYLTYVQLSEVLWGLGRIDEVKQVLEPAIRRWPGNVILRYQLARIHWNYYVEGHDARYVRLATQEYREILRIHPFAGALTAAAALEMMETGDLARMRADLDQLAKMPLAQRDGDRAVWAASLGALFERKPDQAIAALNLTARAYFEDTTIQSPSAWAYALAELERGHPHSAAEYWQQAEQVLRQRLRDDPAGADVYRWQLAATLAWEGRREEAAAEIAPFASVAQEAMTDGRAFALAFYYAAAGDAARLAAVAARTRTITAPDLRYDPWWDRVREAPEFRKLLAEKELK